MGGYGRLGVYNGHPLIGEANSSGFESAVGRRRALRGQARADGDGVGRA